MEYPNKIKKTTIKTINYSNRGMDLEHLINETNDYYVEQNTALIYKKPTPIGISEAVYTEHGRVIKNGYFKAPSTLDYNGLYKGKYIEFEAKETQNKTAFPLANFHDHQIKYIKKVIEHGGICFILIKMNNLVYLLKGTDFIDFVETNTRKSIPYEYLQKYGKMIKESFNPSLDYLKIVDEIYFKGEAWYGKEKIKIKKRQKN